MESLEAEGPNAEQIEYWNATSGPKWAALADRIDAQIAPLGLAALEAAAPAAGESALDVGCGCGQTSLQIAGRVGARGRVLGVDLSAPMLSRARERARETGLAHVEFRAADAQTHAFEPGGFDLAFSRFGVMFFSDPAAAFANLARALRPGGRIAFVCWQALARNPWMLRPLAAVAELLPLPAPPAPDAPGPFAFADAERVGELLRAGGLEAVEVEPLEQELQVGGGGELRDVVEFLLQMGPAGAALRDAPAEARARAAEAVTAALEPFQSAEGVRMPSAAWIFRARRPA